MNPATVVLFGSALAVLGSLIAAFGVYLGSVQDSNESKHLLASITGGDSYPCIIVGPGGFFLHIIGDYPLHEVTGEVKDVVILRELVVKKDYSLHRSSKYFDAGTVSPAYGFDIVDRHTNRPISLNDFPRRDSYRFIISFFTRHHTFNFQLALEPSTQDGYWQHAWRVYRDGASEIMAQSIPDDFPREANGEVDFLLLPDEP